MITLTDEKVFDKKQHPFMTNKKQLSKLRIEGKFYSPIKDTTKKIYSLTPGEQMVKKLPATQVTQVRCLGQEDPLQKGMATHSSILAWNLMDRGAWQATVHGTTKNLTCLSD